MADGGREVQARALLQQCLHARLQVRPADGDAEAQWVEVTPGPVRGTMPIFLSSIVGGRACPFPSTHPSGLPSCLFGLASGGGLCRTGSLCSAQPADDLSALVS